MSANHVFQDCSAIKAARSRLKIDKFIASYKAVGHEDSSTLMAFVNGHNMYNVQIDDISHRDHGKSLVVLRETCKSTWCNSKGGMEELEIILE